MKTAEFNDLCRREHEQGCGVVVKLYLTDESHAELIAEILGNGPLEFPDGPPPGQVGARLDSMVNPATRTAVEIGRAVTKALFADTAEVMRRVPVADSPA